MRTLRSSSASAASMACVRSPSLAGEVAPARSVFFI
jgi:hypothetical protein